MTNLLRYDVEVSIGSTTLEYRDVLLIVTPGDLEPSDLRAYAVMVHEADENGEITETVLRLTPTEIVLSTTDIGIVGDLVTMDARAEHYRAEEAPVQLIARPASRAHDA